MKSCDPGLISQIRHHEQLPIINLFAPRSAGILFRLTVFLRFLLAKAIVDPSALKLEHEYSYWPLAQYSLNLYTRVARAKPAYSLQ